ncbi:hypothetical protein ACQKPT_17120 [Pseudomonas monteilii]|uniref:hypothetical protein n=1 Tax=Pseudomonas monteilii TaxID=76759 RepID=UPI003D028CE4
MMTPILKNLEMYKHHPFESMAPSIVDFISGELKKLPDNALAKDSLILLRIIECFLQLAKIRLTSVQEFRNTLPDFDKKFEGAIWSREFITLDPSRRSRYSRVWRLIKSLIIFSRPELAKATRVEPAKMSPAERQMAVEEFESMDKCPEALWYWSGWPVINQTGKRSYLPLGNLYKRYGFEFSKRFYNTYCSAVQNQRAVGVQGIRSLINYLADNAHTYSKSSLQDPKITKSFWVSFRRHYFYECYTNGCKLVTTSKAWLYSLEPFSKKLVASGLFAAPYKGMPTGTPTFNGSHSPNHRVRDDGCEENIKLTFPIPLEVSDDKAIELIFGQVQHDLEKVRLWAKNKIDAAKTRLDTFAQSCAKANLNKHDNTLSAPGSLEEICHQTYERIGFATHNDLRISNIYNVPLRKVAEILPLPSTNTVIPFAYFLIAHHSEITPDFLTGCNLYDKHGILTGLEKTDAGWYLVGNKYRKGAELSQQKILLNQQTYSAITTLIGITAPVREYLKKRNDPLACKLFITTGAGLQTPKGPKTLTASRVLRPQMANDFKRLGVPDDKALTLSQLCTLTAVRALGGVARYIETESLVAASKALGHTHFDYKLLKRYIPKPLITFFSDRWMRVFHQGFILEAMEGSPYSLAATDFSTQEEVHQFLSTHALKIRKSEQGKLNSEKPKEKKEVVFCIDELTLASMLKISKTTDADLVTANDRYWSGIAKCLIAHIESEECARPDFQHMLEQIKATDMK